MFIKHFELPVDDRNPAILLRLETRFIVMPVAGEPYGVTYKWRPDGSDADLLAGGMSEVIDITDAGGGTFTVYVHFSSPVTGLSADDFEITGGNAGSLTGSGADYQLAIAPEPVATLSVRLPAGRANDAGGAGNYESATRYVVVFDSSLVTWLKLDDGTGSTTMDHSPQENHGTLVGMEETDWIPGRFGQALAFDNTDERVTINNAAAGDFTVSLWLRTIQVFNTTNNPPGGNAVTHADSPGPTNDFLIAGTRSGGVDRISFQTGHADGSPNSILHGSTAVNSGAWTHVAVTRRQSTGEMKIYINGQLDATRTGSTSALGSNPLLSLGATPGNAANSFQGDLDQFRIHNRVLEAAEIQGLFSEDGSAIPPYENWLAAWLPGLSQWQYRDLDPDQDGRSNFAEFAFGGNPLALDIFPVPFNQAADGSVTLSYLARKAPAGADYQLQVADGLLTWSDAGPGITSTTTEEVPGTEYQQVTVTYMPPAPSPRLFFRVEALPD